MIKGEVFKIDRWKNGEVHSFMVKRICKRHINVTRMDLKEQWAMPYNRIKDIVKEESEVING